MYKTSNERIYEIIRSPLVSEKSTFISQFNYYVFKVSPNSTKMEIKNAVENIFKVEVKSVNTLNQKGKNHEKYKFTNKSDENGYGDMITTSKSEREEIYVENSPHEIFIRDLKYVQKRVEIANKFKVRNTLI